MEKSSEQFSIEEAKRLIRRFEGLSLIPYQCPAGVWTVGYGHVKNASINGIPISAITITQAEQWLCEDTKTAYLAVKRLIPMAITDYQAAALTSFVFNLGAGALQRSTLRQTILRHASHKDIHTQWMRWVWAGGHKLPGLVRRRQAELGVYFRKW